MPPRRYNMPLVSRFRNGLKVLMFYNDHVPPHVHVDKGGDVQFVAAIADPEVPTGLLPKPDRQQLVRWIKRHEDALLENWDRCMDGEAPSRIPPP
jgi:hypothetical protein